MHRSDEIAHLVKIMARAGKPPRAPIVYDSDPARLVRRLVKAIDALRPTFKWEG